MARTLFISIDPTAFDARWQLFENGSPKTSAKQGRLSDALRYTKNAHVVVCVPSEEAFISYVTLPGKNRSKLLKAVPYAVEDQLVDEIDDLHFALSPAAVDGQYLVTAVENRLMEYWDKSLKQAGIRADVIIPDVMLLPAGINGWTVLLEPDRALVRTPLGMFSSDISNLPLLLTNFYQQAGDDAPDSVIVHDCSDSNHMAVLTALTENINFDVQDCAEGEFSIFSENYNTRHCANLMQGDYGVTDGIGRYIKPWYSAATLAAIWLVWQLGLNILNYYELKGQNSRLTQEMAKVYKQAFPKEAAPRPGTERAAMESGLMSLRGSQGKSGVSFQDILVDIAPVIKKYPGLKMKQIKYRNGVVELSFDTKQSELIDKFEAELSGKTSWQVEINSRNTKSDITQVRMTVGG